MEADIMLQIMVGYQPGGRAEMRKRSGGELGEAARLLKLMVRCDRELAFTPSCPPSVSPAACAWRKFGPWS